MSDIVIFDALAKYGHGTANELRKQVANICRQTKAHSMEILKLYSGPNIAYQELNNDETRKRTLARLECCSRQIAACTEEEMDTYAYKGAMSQSGLCYDLLDALAFLDTYDSHVQHVKLRRDFLKYLPKHQ